MNPLKMSMSPLKPVNHVHRALTFLHCSSDVDVNSLKLKLKVSNLKKTDLFTAQCAGVQKQHDRNCVTFIILSDCTVCAHSL